MDASLTTLLFHILIGLVAGAVIAAAHLLSLLPSVRWMAAGRIAPAVGLQIARLGTLGLLLLGLAMLGPVVLVSAVASLIPTRAIMMRRMKAKLT